MKRTVWILIIGFVLGGVVYGIIPKGRKNKLGQFLSHDVLHNYTMPLGKTRQGGNLRLPQQSHEFREVVRVPAFYGKLVNVTTQGPDSVLWYKGEGALRNVVLRDTKTRLYEVEKQSVDNLASEFVQPSD